MKYLKILGLAVVSAMAMMAFAAGSASATTLEVGGAAKKETVTISASLKTGTSAILKDTAGFSKNTCTTSDVHGHTTVFTGSVVTGPLTGHTHQERTEGKVGLTFENCTRPVVVDDPGTLEIAWTSGTNGTVSSEEATVTVGSAIGTLHCDTEATTHIGTLTGVASGNATMDIDAVLDCGIIPSAKWEATYSVTSPGGLGVIK